MGIGSFFKRLFGAPPDHDAITASVEEQAAQPRELEVFQAKQHEPVDGERLLIQFRDQLSSQAQAHQQLNVLLGSLTTTLNALPQLARQQGQVLETLVEGAARARLRDQAVERSLVHLTEGSERQTQVLGLAQQQLDLNHEVSVRVAESLRETAGALSTFAATSDRQAHALESLALATQRRVAQSDRLEKALQLWLTAVAGLCTLALLYAVWVATRGPVIFALPFVDPIPAAANTARPIPAVVPPSVAPALPAAPPAVLQPAVPPPAVAPAVLPAAVAPAVLPAAVAPPTPAPAELQIPQPVIAPIRPEPTVRPALEPTAPSSTV